MNLSIKPSCFAEQYHAHTWHKKINDYQLPAKEIIYLENAFVSRSQYITDESALGAVYDSIGNLLESSRHYRRSKDLTADVVRSIDPGASTAGKKLTGRYLYLGWYFNHFGHFLLESLCRCWALSEIERVADLKILFHIHDPNVRPNKKYFKLLSLLGVKENQITFIQKDCQVEELIVPSQQAVLARAMSVETLALYQRITKTVLKESRSNTENINVYISRRLLATDKRKALNEYSLEKAFHAAGYQVVHPQLLSIRDQVLLFAKARNIAGTEGTALHHLLFSLPGAHMRLLGTVPRMADVITQVTLNQFCNCDTTLVLQEHFPLEGVTEFQTSFMVSLKTQSYFLPENVQGCADDELNPDIHHYLEAMGWFDKHELKEALRAIEAAIDENPYSPSYHRFHARVLAKLKHYSAAADALYKVKKLLPSNIGFLTQLSWFLLQAGRCSEAQEIAEKVIEKEPENAMGYAHFSQAISADENPIEELFYMEKAAFYAPDNKHYQRQCADLCMVVGDEGKGRYYLQRLASLENG